MFKVFSCLVNDIFMSRSPHSSKAATLEVSPLRFSSSLINQYNNRLALLERIFLCKPRLERVSEDDKLVCLITTTDLDL
jgi:hypothetical protein